MSQKREQIIDNESNDNFILGEIFLPAVFGVVILTVLGVLALTDKL